MTQELFREDAYIKDCKATVTAITDDGGIVCNKTVFYPTGGGQPGDSGQIEFNQQSTIISTTLKSKESDDIIHIPRPGSPLPTIGDEVILRLDWQRRYLHMRMHTALHLLCSVVPCGVTGGQIGNVKSRLDFDIGEQTLDKEVITQQLNELIQNDYQVTQLWITDEELEQNPELVRTMSVQPPRGAGKVRLLKIGDDVDLQPCGGTHVKQTAEIGPVKVSKIENKGKRNRRVNLVFG